MKYTDNGVVFDGIENAGLITGGPKLSKGKYDKDENGNIIYNMPIINAIDIDWNNAQVEGLNGRINSTGDMLSKVGGINSELHSTMEALENTIGDVESLETLVEQLETLANGNSSSIVELLNKLNEIEELLGSDDDENNNSLLERLTRLEELLTGGDNPDDPSNPDEPGDNTSIIDKLTNLANQLSSLEDRVDSYHVEYSFVYHLNNVSSVSSNVQTMKRNDTVTLQFNANTGYLMPDSVSVENAAYVYNKTNRTITISNPTASQIIITINTDVKRQCTFNIPSLTNLSCELISPQSAYVIDDTFNIKLTVTGDSELWGLPTNISPTGCTVVSYNSSTGEATLKCSGSHDTMTISATAKDITVYYFAVALESNAIFIKTNGVITGLNYSNIESLEGYMKKIGECPVNFVTGFTAPSSVNVEGQYVWFIIPSNYFNRTNFNFRNGSNNYLLKQSNIQDLTTSTKIKDTVVINPTDGANKKQYCLVCVSNNGLGGAVEFKKI